MVDFCTVTATARDSTFALRPSQKLVFNPVGPGLEAAGATLLVRTPVVTIASALGAISVSLTPGAYVLSTQNDDGKVEVPCVVPDQASATIDECIAAVPSASWSALALSLLAMGLPFFEDRTLAHGSAMVASGGLFVAPNPTPTLGLTVWKKIPVGGSVFTSSAVGPVFPSTFFPPGALGAPGLAVNGDSDTGIFSPAANQVAGVAGGVLGWLLSSSGLQISQPITGTAVTQAPLDTTAGRLLKVGDFGIGGGVAGATETLLANIDALTTPAGFHQTTSGTTGTFPVGESLFGQLIVFRHNNNSFTQVWMSALSDTLYTRRYRSTDVPAFSPWRRLLSPHNILGVVSQTGGVPTGRVIERGSNANGEFVRFADGTQMCTRADLTTSAASTAFGNLFISGQVAWTFPASFVVPPVVSGSISDDLAWLTFGVPTATNVVTRNYRAVSSALTPAACVVAHGRWF